MKELYKERHGLMIELMLNNYYIKAWLDEGMPEDWAPNALRCAEKIEALTSNIVRINALIKEDKK